MGEEATRGRDAVSYKKHPPLVYIVRWPDSVTKIGFTEHRRWRSFEIRGAAVLARFEFPTTTAAFLVEGLGHEWMRLNGTYAFDALGDSLAHMGSGGGGYAECFHLNGDKVSEMVSLIRLLATSHEGTELPSICSTAV